MSQKNYYKLIFILLFIIGTFLRLWHVDFGLPHSFYADEPEFAELAIKYTFELKDIVTNNNWYKLIPISYVYGTFPSYVLTVFTILFTKIAGLINYAFDKTTLYIFMRSLTGILSLILIPTISFLYYKLFKDKAGALLAFLLVALNWKLIAHAHYVNADIFITVLLSLSFLSLYFYFQNEEEQPKNYLKRNTLFTLLTGILFGLAVGTKITSLIALPFYWYLFLRKKDFRSFFAFNFLILAVFMFTNPFSIIFASDFVFRIYSMSIKEAGLVFDSVDLNPFKYLIALSWISTLPVFLIGLFGIFSTFRLKNFKSIKPFHIFLLGNFVIYLVFYSIQSRRVDRWLLPILPILIIYASHGFSTLYKFFYSYLSKKNSDILLAKFGLVLVGFSLSYYLYVAWIITTQFQRDTPKSAAYLWMQKNTDIQNPFIKTLAYTEEGLDPLNKLPYADVTQVSVYEGSGASLAFPIDPYLYKYVILSSRPMDNFKRVPVVQKYPDYAKRWVNFEDIVTKSGDFKLIQQFKTTTPNLIPLSEVSIYENLK